MRLFPLTSKTVAILTVSLGLAPVFGLARTAQGAQFLPSHSTEYAEALSLLNKKKWAEAAIVLRNVLKSNPGFTNAAIRLSQALVYTGRREEALSVLSQARVREKGKLGAALVRQGRVISRLFLTQETFRTYQEGKNLVLEGKYKLARERFLAALEQEPDNVEILMRLSQCLVMEGDFDSAAERLRLAKRLSPEEPEIRLWLGRALHQRGEMAEALAELRSARGDLEASELAPIWLAEVYASSNQKGMAIQVLDEDLKKQPFHLMSLFAMAKAKFQLAEKDTAQLWNVRKDLQLALSRYDQFAQKPKIKFEGDLGLAVRGSGELRSQIESLLEKVEGKIEEQDAQKVSAES